MPRARPFHTLLTDILALATKEHRPRLAKCTDDELVQRFAKWSEDCMLSGSSLLKSRVEEVKVAIRNRQHQGYLSPKQDRPVLENFRDLLKTGLARTIETQEKQDGCARLEMELELLREENNRLRHQLLALRHECAEWKDRAEERAGDKRRREEERAIAHTMLFVSRS